jgi:hypothetical protein
MGGIGMTAKRPSGRTDLSKDATRDMSGAPNGLQNCERRYGFISHSRVGDRSTLRMRATNESEAILNRWRSVR